MQPWMQPMLCEKADAVPIAPGWMLEPKLDGWRGIVWRDEDVRVYGGRNGSDYTGALPYLEQEVMALLPRGTCLDGELIAPNGWGNVQSAMTSGPHRPSEASPALRFVFFDVLKLLGEDVRHQPWTERRAYIEQIASQLAGRMTHLRLSIAIPATAEAHENILDLGAEGTVAKRASGVYVSGRRTREWVKIKPAAKDTVDCTIVGFKQGTGDNSHLYGAIEFELPNGERSRCKILNAKLRRDMTAHPERFIGMTLEVRHWGETDAGKLRHPQFHRLRTDR